KKNNIPLSWHYWLGGQFWVGYGWYWGVSSINFFFEVCGLKLSEDMMERAQAYRKVCESVNYIWPNSDFIIVCARPRKINRDTDGRLHSDTEKSIEYPDGWGLYHLHGVGFPERLWKRVVSGNMPFEEILKIEDIDQRTQAMRYGDSEKFLKYTNAKLLDEYLKAKPDGEMVKYQLYRIPQGEIFTEDAYYVFYDCPSTERKYMSGVIKCDTVAEAMAWKQDISVEEWKGLVPLVSES
ncbi:MAG: hypothetical protein KGI08_10915, partial [Thaumarchaeota archaeon]|nr:hypothetical protein [Nitrososphaerota archaeon]